MISFIRVTIELVLAISALGPWSMVVNEEEFQQDRHGNWHIAYTECADGVPTVYIGEKWVNNINGPTSVLVHQLAHAYDCALTGSFSDPIMLRYADPNIENNQCYVSDAEFFACWVEQYRRLP